MSNKHVHIKSFHEESSGGNDSLTSSIVELSNAELQEGIERTMKENESLRKEIALLESFVKRSAPHLLVETPSKRHGPPISLTADQKFFISTRELEAIRESIEQKQISGERELAQLQSLREETETRISEIKKEAFEFRRDVVSGAVNPRTGKIMAEKVVQALEGKLRAKEQQIEKLKLKNFSLKSQCQKVEGQLQHKEEMGEVFLPIDFDQLKIENQQYLEKIEERNQELLTLKVIAGNTVQVLNSNKKRLTTLTNEHEQLEREIAARRAALGRINKETALVTQEIEKATMKNRKLKAKRDEYIVPEVIDYVGLKANLHEQQKKVHDWERKVEIAEMAARRQRTLARSKEFTNTTDSNNSVNDNNNNTLTIESLSPLQSPHNRKPSPRVG
eukprot:TRINITY_DN3176_c0_g1_i1.p1 TRINITY_DN3176_c0_g1~~TRINITY_DN3176_c0_g1_i1.p1  ORF type:complete len:416 (-),score=110.36 TRINITY_DN3176_c0_g1_i1:95-1264(-)